MSVSQKQTFGILNVIELGD